MHDALFANPSALEVSDLSDYAEKLVLDKAAFEACLSGALTAKVIRADMAEGLRLGVKSTPSFFLGRVGVDGSIQLVKRINGAQPLSEPKVTTVHSLVSTTLSDSGGVIGGAGEIALVLTRVIPYASACDDWPGARPSATLGPIPRRIQRVLQPPAAAGGRQSVPRRAPQRQ